MQCVSYGGSGANHCASNYVADLLAVSRILAWSRHARWALTASTGRYRNGAEQSEVPKRKPASEVHS